MLKRNFPLMLAVSIILLIFLIIKVPISGADGQRSTPQLQGHLIQKNCWDNYGLTIKVFRGTNLVNSTLTSLNGYFAFSQLPTGLLQIYCFDGDYYLAQRTIINKGTPQQLLIKYTDKNFHPLYIGETLGVIISILLISLTISLGKKIKELRLALILSGLAFSIILFCSGEFFQALLALLGHEILAANIFTLKHLGLVWFGFLLVLLFFIFPRPADNFKPKLALFSLAIPLLESFLILSWSFLGSDQTFNQIWHFSYADLRQLIISQLIILLCAALVRIGWLFHQEKNILLKNKLAFLLWSIALLAILIFVLGALPVLCFGGSEFFAGQYILTAYLAGMILFYIITYAVTRYKIIPFNQLVNRSLTYTLASFILIFIYASLIIFLEKSFIRFNNYLLNAYIIMFFIAIALPLKNYSQKIIDSLFFGNYLKQRQALLQLSGELVNYLDQAKILSLLRRRLRQNLAVSLVKIIDSKSNETLGPQGFLTKDQPSFTAIVGKQKNIELILPLSNRQFRGYLLLGKKTNDLDYTESELELLQAVAAQVAIAISNTKLHNTLLQTQKEIEQAHRLAALGTMAAGLAHEIKNPLTSINTLVQLFPERYRTATFRQTFSTIVPRQLNKINTLVTNMLTLAKPSTAKFKTVALAPLLEKTIALLAVAAKKNNVLIQKNLEPEQKISGDETALEQAFLNLGLNAVEAMPNGGTLSIALRSSSTGIQLEFGDTGSGIAPENLTKIFDPFFSTKTLGTGLGLSITHKILENHGVKIKVFSQLNRGTNFLLSFPQPGR